LLGYPNRTSDEATKQAVIDVALAYRIMTEFTSFVAVDEHPDGTVRTIEQPLPIPQGTTYEGLGDGTIALGNTGLIGKGGGGSGYGSGTGAGFGGRGKRVAQVRSSKPTVQG